MKGYFAKGIKTNPFMWRAVEVALRKRNTVTRGPVSNKCTCSRNNPKLSVSGEGKGDRIQTQLSRKGLNGVMFCESDKKFKI